MGKARPAISRLSFCHQEVIACKTLADWTEDECVVYPIPPTRPTLKNDEADKSDNDPESHNKGSDDEPADDDRKSEHGGGSGEGAMHEKKDQESEDESDDQSKAPKDQTAVSRDSGLGTSSSGHGVGAGALASNPSVNLSTGIPLPTQLPSMDHFERLANDLYAYSGELFRGLEETSMVMLDRILSGFKRLGGHAREYIHDTAAITINFLELGAWRQNWNCPRP